MSNGALVVSPAWADAAKDGFNIETTATNTIDMTGATISLDVYVPESYIVDGKLAMQIYFKDATGKFANGGWKETAWGPWRYSGSEVSTTNTASDNHYGWATLTFVINSSGVDGSWGYNPDGINITQIKSFGLDIESHGKPIGIIGDIKIDNVILPGM